MLKNVFLYALLKFISSPPVITNNFTNIVAVNNRIYLNKTLITPNDQITLLDSEWAFNYDNLKTQPIFPEEILDLYETVLNQSRNNNIFNTKRILFKINTKHANILQFNLNSLNLNETILEAELRFYLSMNNKHKSFLKTSAVIRLYQLENWDENYTNITFLSRVIDTQILLNVGYVANLKNSWQNFKIKKSIVSWINGQQNFGYVVTLSTFESTEMILLSAENHGIFKTHLLIISTTENEKQILTKPPKDETIEGSQGCQKHKVVIDFKDYGALDKIIIKPDSFIAYDCFGNCEHLHSNHAKLIKYKKEQYRRGSFRKACCVPLNYLPLPVMFYDKFNNIVIKIYENMIVNKCACV